MLQITSFDHLAGLYILTTNWWENGVLYTLTKWKCNIVRSSNKTPSSLAEKSFVHQGESHFDGFIRKNIKQLREIKDGIELYFTFFGFLEPNVFDAGYMTEIKKSFKFLQNTSTRTLHTNTQSDHVEVCMKNPLS